MTKLDEVGVIGDDNGSYWGSKRKYPTKALFLAAIRELEGDDGGEFTEDEVESVYLRRSKAENSDYDFSWCLCEGPARGATAAWGCS